MKNAILSLLAILFLFLFILLTTDTKYEPISYIFMILFLGAMYIKDLYKYNKNKHQFYNNSYELKRDNLRFNIINCLILGGLLYNHNYKIKIQSEYTNFNISLDLLWFLAALIQVYICFIHKPILSTEGFLCSDGKFIKFNDINNILIEDNKIKSHKKITVTYEPKDSILFKLDKTSVDSKVFQINNLDYQSIKNHIKIYAPNKLIEKSISQAE